MAALKALFTVAAPALSLIFLAACEPATRCTVENHSASTLTHLVISGRHFSVSAPDVAPGQSCIVNLSPRGEEGTLSVIFQANGREYRYSEPTYFEASGYEVKVSVSPEFLVTAQVGIQQPVPLPATPIPPKGAS